MKLEKLEYEVIDNVGFITLDYMKNFNAIDVEMATEIITAIKALEEDPEAKVIVIRGQERAFSAGGDIGFFYKKFQEETNGHLDHTLTDLVGEMTLAERNCSKLIITSVSGPAAGAGVGLALSGDFVIAADNASFIYAFVNLGLAPDTGATYLLTKTVGTQKAADICYFGKPFGADLAKEMGMVYKVVPKEELAAETLKLANKLKAGPLADYTNIKKQINGSYFDNYRTYIKDVEAPTQNSSGDTEDFKEGVRAFIEKRKANFQGR